ncbi:hypothetical protein ACHQM5_001961 [Ranunculus cassubicifolius]
MGIRFALDWKCSSSQITSPLANLSSSSSKQQKQLSTSVRSREVSYESARAFILSVTPDESETMCKSPSKTYGALQLMDTESKDTKMNLGTDLLYDQLDDVRMPIQDYTSVSRDQVLEVKGKSRFNLLHKNLERIEETFMDKDLLALEKEILIQLGKLGALELFRACLSRSLRMPSTIDDQVSDLIVRSRKKEERKLRREKTSEKICALIHCAESVSKLSRRAAGSTVRNSSRSRTRRHKVARNEAEMSRRVKDVADLETIRTKLEAESGQVASFRRWAEAVGVEEKVLQQRLHYGWFCRDKLLKSTHSLIVYLARNYRGLGISLEDLYQAGNVGVLKGAERFDHERGCQFSTYVQYWIRKEMSSLIEHHSREIHIPVALSRRINQIKKARKSLYNLHGRYPDDEEIARFSGLSVAKIQFASKCPRIVGSLDQKMGDSLSAKYMNYAEDKSIKTPEEIVTREHLQKDIYKLLQGLHPRESQVIFLRYGFWDGQCKSLGEIAGIFKCTKEWIRKVEKSALNKLRKEEAEQRNLSQYLNLQL